MTPVDPTKSFVGYFMFEAMDIIKVNLTLTDISIFDMANQMLYIIRHEDEKLQI
jgi:hypothetical protein